MCIRDRTIINLTPHAINFLREDNSVLTTIEPSGTIARASQTLSLIHIFFPKGKIVVEHKSAATEGTGY